jgi:hypothetical protein
MQQESSATYSALFGDLELRIWDSNGAYPWSVTDSTTGEVTRGVKPPIGRAPWSIRSGLRGRLGQREMARSGRRR